MIPFSIFFEKGAQSLSPTSNILINRELILPVLNKSNQKLILYYLVPNQCYYEKRSDLQKLRIFFKAGN